MKLVTCLVVTALLVSGCAALGLAPATTTQDKIAYGYSGVTAALNTLASATSQGLISSADATQVNNAIMAAKGELDQANAVAATNAPVATQALAVATAALSQISSYLACKQQKGATCPLP